MVVDDDKMFILHQKAQTMMTFVTVHTNSIRETTMLGDAIIKLNDMIEAIMVEAKRKS